MAILLSRAMIDAAKQRLRIPRLWRLLNIPGKPQASCHSPFRDDKRASFSVFDEGRQAKDHATGENFDAPAFLGKALGLSTGEALKRFIAMAGGEEVASNNYGRNKTGDGPQDSVRRRPDLSKFRSPVAAELHAIARDRALDLAAPAIATRLGCLKVGNVCGIPSWILTDPAGRNAEARRIGRLPYPSYGELAQRKVHTIRGSCKSWPVGLGVDRALIEKASLIAVVEGGPDYLAAWHFIYRAKRRDVLPIAILGRTIHGLHADALVLLEGKRVKFFPHVDPDSGALAQVSIICERLRTVGCELSYFDFAGLRARGGTPVKDLNDATALDPSQSADITDLFL